MRHPFLIILLVWASSLGVFPRTIQEQIEEELLGAVNAARSRNQSPPLACDERTQKAARLHSQAMAELDFFGHESPVPGATLPLDRLAQQGLAPELCAENIFYADGLSPQQAVRQSLEQWLKSPVHRANLLDKSYRWTGTGVERRGSEIWITQLYTTGE